MPLFTSPSFCPCFYPDHMTAAREFAKDLAKASGKRSIPDNFKVTGQTVNELGGTVYFFEYELIDPLGAITATGREIHVIHYAARTPT